MAEREPPSPCIQVCAIDSESRLCLGCYRTLEEISAWPRLSIPDKRALLETLSARRKEYGEFRFSRWNRRRR